MCHRLIDYSLTAYRQTRKQDWSRNGFKRYDTRTDSDMGQLACISSTVSESVTN